MSITKIRTIIRPNTDVAFFQASAEDIEYINETYVITGKRLSRKDELRDALTQVITTVWKDQAAFEEWATEVVYNEEANAYYEANNFIVTLT